MTTRTDLKGVGKALDRINRKILKMQDIAETRSLNIIVGQQRTEIAKDVSKEYGILQGSAKKHMKQIKATRVDKNAGLDISSTRTNVVDAKKIKNGISFRKKGGGRAKIKTNVKVGASKPFMIRAKAGGQAGGDDIITKGQKKLVAVYVPKPFNKFTDISQRKVATFLGSSIARMVETMEIKSKDLKAAVKAKFPEIYKKQLDKAKFTGGK